MNNTFSARYRRAAELLPFRADFEERVLERASAGEKPRRLSPSARIPVKIRRAAEIAGLAACLVLAVLCISTLFRGGAVKLPHSTGSVSVRVVGNPDLPVRVPMTWEEAEEQALFDEADAVFSGRVQKLETLELDVGGELTYRSRVTVLVDRTWKGEAAAGEMVSLLLPYAVHGESGETEIINRLSEGMKALFLAQTHTEEDVLSNDKGTLALMDTAAYGLKDDRYLILRGAEGEAVLCPGAYPSLPERSSYAEAEALADRLTRQKLTVATISASTSATTTSTAAETTTTIGVATTTRSKTTAATTPTTQPVVSDMADKYYYYTDLTKGRFNRIDDAGLIQEVTFDFLPGSRYQTWSDGQWIYYVAGCFKAGDEEGLCRSRADGSGGEWVMRGNFSNAVFYKNKDYEKLVFSSGSTENGKPFSGFTKSLYVMDKDGKNLKELCANPYKKIVADADALYAFSSNAEGYQLYRISIEDGKQTLLYSQPSGTEEIKCEEFYEPLVHEGWIYYYESYYAGGIKDDSYNNPDRLVRIRTDGTDKMIIHQDTNSGDIGTDGNCLYFNQYKKEWVIYGEFYRNYLKVDLYSVPLDNITAEPTAIKLPAGHPDARDLDRSEFFSIKNGWIYYSYGDVGPENSYLCTRRIRVDGSEQQELVYKKPF